MGKMSKALSGLMAFVAVFAEVEADAASLKINATQPGVSGAVCVRAIIRKSDGSYLSGEWGNPSWPPIAMRGKAMAPQTVVQVPTGVTQITIGKGPDYGPITITTNLANDAQTYTINVILQPALDLYGRGWRGGDAHVHYIHGEDEVRRTPQEAWAMCAAGGMNFASFCEEHLGAGTLTRQQMYDQWKPYEASECALWMGVEEPKNEWGHHVGILYDPWAIRSALPYHWGINSIHEQGGVCYPVHPQRLFPGRYYDNGSTRQWFFLPSNNHLKAYPLDALIGHLMDGWSGVSDEAHASTLLAPYFKLLEMGYKIPLLADSDFCMDRLNNGEKGIGGWLTYYHLEGKPVTRASIAEAMRRGRVMSTTGPLVLFNIDEAMSGDTLPADGAGRTVRIEASYTFNGWTLSTSNFNGSDLCKIQQIDLFRNGQIIRTWNPNTPTATVQHTINESTPNSYYMVRVLGNQNQWMAGYASPIYFDNTSRPRQPQVFKSLIKGHLYDSVSGSAMTGTVSCVRYGKTEWTIPTDSQGLFQAQAPLDAQLVAKDRFNRQFTQDVLNYEPAWSFCHYLADNYAGNMAGSIEPFKNIVREMRWEFPMGFQLAGSYVRTNLSGNAAMSNFSIASAPAPTPGKAHTEIVMVLLDKTQAQIGDTVNYAVIFRQPQGGTPAETLSMEWKGWDPNYPTMYNKYGKNFHYNDHPSGLVSLGGGFYLRQGSVVVPSWVGNATETTGAIRIFATVRSGGILEHINMLVPIGPTRRELLVSSTWDGFPAAWGELGIGPCNFFREYSAFEVRYSDYRSMTLNLNLNGQPITIRPKIDTAHVADADNAVFYETFYYEAQCEPQFRNIPVRDPVRTQPAEPDFASVPLQNPPDTSAPTVAAIEPLKNAQVPAGAVPFYYLIYDAGQSGAATATLLINGTPRVTNTSANPITITLASGTYTWQVRGTDLAGNQALSDLRTLIVGSGAGDTSPPTVSLTSPANNGTVSGSSVIVSGNAVDNVSVAGVQFKLDGANLGAEDVSFPFSVTWNTISATNGTHTLRAVARDAAGNRSTSAVVAVVINNVVTNIPNTNLPKAVVWVDDAVPAGGVPGGDGGDAWTWVSTNPTPIAGSLAHKSNLGTNTHQHFFSYTTSTLSVRTGDTLFAYVYLDPANVPRQVMLQWNDGSWEHRAYWGDNIMTFGTEGTASRKYVGPLPPAGRWTRLEVPAKRVGLQGRTLKGMAFTLYGGRAAWDYAGKFRQVLPQAQMAETGLTLSWESEPGVSYRVLCKNSMSDTGWIEMSGPLTAVAEVSAFIDTTAYETPQRFYQVIEE